MPIPQTPPPKTIIGNENIQVEGQNITIQKIGNLIQEDRSLTTFRHRAAMLELVKKTWIKDVLEKSLFNETLIELGFETRPNQVNRLWDIQLQMPEREDQLLPAGTSVLQILDELGKAILILGLPGAGKTTTLLELARDAIARAEQDLNAPIPVVFNLSSWSDPKESIIDWLKDEFRDKYNVATSLSSKWIEHDALLLLLDGLDEVQTEYRGACVLAINVFRQQHGFTGMVVCSRVVDYEELPTKLNLNGAIYLEPLTLKQINRYFEDIGSSLDGVHQMLLQNSLLQELAQQPLMLSIMILAYKDTSLDMLKNDQFKTTDDLRRNLFDRYIYQMFHRVGRTKNDYYSFAQTTRWLTWLAQRMIEQSQTIFSLENMSEGWLPTHKQQRFFSWASKLPYRLIGAIIFGLCARIISFKLNEIFSFGSILFPVLFISLVVIGLFSGWMVFGDFATLDAAENIKWSWKRAIWGFIGGVIFSSFFWVIGDRFNLLLAASLASILGGLIFGLDLLDRKVGTPIRWSWKIAWYGIAIGLVLGVSSAVLDWWKSMLVLGFLYGISFGINSESLPSKNTPNQGFYQSIKHALIVGGACGVITGVVLGWSSGVMTGLIIGLMFGGNFVLAHLILRLILKYYNYAPWNYVGLLDYCAERVFLHKVGGGYIFVHRLLMEHFASIRNEENEPGVIAHRGKTYRMMGKYDQALSDFNQAIQFDRKDSWAIIQRGITYREMGKYEQALTDFNQAIQIESKDVWAVAQRGITYREMGKYEQALTDFNQVIQIESKDAWAVAQRGTTYRKMGKYEQALADINQAIQLFPKYDSVISQRSEIYILTGKLDQALIDINLAIQIQPDSSWRYYLRSQIHKLQNRTNDFGRDIEKAVSLARSYDGNNSDKAWNLFNLALYELVLGHTEQASHIYRQGFSNNATPGMIIDAIFDLDNLMKLFPDILEAKKIRDLLRAELDKKQVS